VFLKDIIHYCDRVLNATVVATTSRIRSAAILVLPTVGNYKVRVYRVAFGGVTSIPNFIKIRQVVLELNRVARRSDKHGRPYVRSFCADRANNVLFTRHIL
jgi:hypothetical protein